MCMRGACSWCDLSGLKRKLERDLKMDHSKLIKTSGSGRIWWHATTHHAYLQEIKDFHPFTRHIEFQRLP